MEDEKRIHRDEIKRILYEETQLLDLYGNELADAIAGHLICNNSRQEETEIQQLLTENTGFALCLLICYVDGQENINRMNSVRKAVTRGWPDLKIVFSHLQTSRR